MSQARALADTMSVAFYKSKEARRQQEENRLTADLPGGTQPTNHLKNGITDNTADHQLQKDYGNIQVGKFILKEKIFCKSSRSFL